TTMRTAPSLPGYADATPDGAAVPRSPQRLDDLREAGQELEHVPAGLGRHVVPDLGEPGVHLRRLAADEARALLGERHPGAAAVARMPVPAHQAAAVQGVEGARHARLGEPRLLG